MLHTVRSAAIVAFHDACLARADWPSDEAAARALLPTGPLADAWGWVLVNHKFNCSLWNEEDLARRTQAADADIAAANESLGFAEAAAARPTPARAADDVATKRSIAKMKGYVGDACGECGNFTLLRNGTCLKCDTCGSTTGCS
jgi:predicted RNA-binding Zn-ribbon protein involved in translation (DUF1610 family)